MESIQYYIPTNCKYEEITEQDIEDFFGYSDRGLHKDRAVRSAWEPKKIYSGFDALIHGKRWRGIHMEMYEEGILVSDDTYYNILGGLDNNPTPRAVVDFLKRELFKGIDADLIEKTHQLII